jgi:hypothetical protein
MACAVTNPLRWSEINGGLWTVDSRLFGQVVTAKSEVRDG